MQKRGAWCACRCQCCWGNLFSPPSVTSIFSACSLRVPPKEFREVTQTLAHTPCVRFFQGAGVGRCAFGVNTPCPLDPLLGSNCLIHYI